MRIASFILATGCALGATTGQATVLTESTTGFGYPYLVVQAQYISPSQARAEEARLGLSRSERREIQRALQVLGYNTGYADGYFGQRTRTAIVYWQEDNGLWPTGYVSRRMLRLMDEQLDEDSGGSDWQHQADLAYWQETGAAGGDIEGMRRYLERYPNGHYADHARSQINAHDEAQRRADRRAWREAEHLDTIRSYDSYLDRFPEGRYADQARQRIHELSNLAGPPEDHRAWQRARQKDTIAIYDRFLRDYPQSSFVDEARARLKELQTPALDIAALEAEENRVLPSDYHVQQFMRGLRQLGYRPANNSPDREGRFSKQTRDVIRTIQRKTGRPITGYVDAWMVNFARHTP